MIIKKITYYLQGKLSEEEELELWVHLLQHPEELALLETYIMYRDWYRLKSKLN